MLLRPGLHSQKVLACRFVTGAAEKTSEHMADEAPSGSHVVTAAPTAGGGGDGALPATVDVHTHLPAGATLLAQGAEAVRHELRSAYALHEVVAVTHGLLRCRCVARCAASVHDDVSRSSHSREGTIQESVPPPSAGRKAHQVPFSASE